MNAWTTFWTWVNENQLAATIIGGLILAALLWVITKIPKVGPHLRRGLRWLWSWRPVSVRRSERRSIKILEDSRDYTDERIVGIADVLGALGVKTSVDVSKLESDLAELKRQVAARPVVEVSPSAPEVQRPMLAPRWQVEYKEGDRLFTHTYTLTNLVPDSAAYRVRLENAPRSGAYFEFKSAAAWADLSGEREVTFTGEIMYTDDHNRFLLQLEWYDENEQYFSRNILLNGPSQWNDKDPNDAPF